MSSTTHSEKGRDLSKHVARRKEEKKNYYSRYAKEKDKACTVRSHILSFWRFSFWDAVLFKVHTDPRSKKPFLLAISFKRPS